MQFQHYDLGHKQAGQIVEVSLQGSAANVRLMDSSNFQSYRSGQRHRFYGGHATRSPVKLAIPRTGYWHVAIDLGGYRGSVRSAIRILPGPLPALNEPALSSVPSLVQGRSELPEFTIADEDERQFDVFVSHASEDKDEVVRPLAQALQANGLSVWYDEFELKIGDSLRRKIDKGLASSRFGVIVLSQTFLRKGWANYELDGLVTRAVTGEQVLLPIWHNITKKEVIAYSPSLADKLARSTATHTMEEIAVEIAEVIRNTGA
ncbi:DUF1883 domain-containing protein [Methylolobus aquaticus]